MDNLLSVLIFMPAVAALIMWVFLEGDDRAARQNARWLGLIATGVTLFAALFLYVGFDPAGTGPQFVEERSRSSRVTFYRVGVDGISIGPILLTALMMPVIVAAAWTEEHRTKHLMIALLLAETFLLGAFAAQDLALFYVFFEASIVPVLLLVGIWGGEGGRLAATRLFVSVLVGAVLLLPGLIILARLAGTTELASLPGAELASPLTLAGADIPGGAATLLWVALFLAFAIRMALWPFHMWLPRAVAGLPPAAMALVLALTLKLGAYGVARLLLPVFPEATALFAPFVLLLGGIGIAVAGFVALRQETLAGLFAYASVAHMGLVVTALFSASRQGIDGGLLALFAHGLAIGGAVLAAGAVANRVNGRRLDAFGGLLVRMPAFALVFGIFVLGLLAMPGSAGFVGLLLGLIGIFEASLPVAALVLLGLLPLTAALLLAFRQIVLGDLIKESLKSISDLDRRERAALTALVALLVLFGIAPSILLDLTGPAVEAMLGGTG
ncbi:MAG: NADH-quinone oxidoreductase subunit M [Pseudomonadota bacterium]